MGNEYEWGINPVQDVLLQTLMLGGDIGNPAYKEDLYKVFSYILENYLKNQGDVVYLDFDVVDIDGYYTLVGNNIITALWLSGVLPDNPTAVMEANKCIVGEWKFSFNIKSKTLKIQNIK